MINTYTFTIVDMYNKITIENRPFSNLSAALESVQNFLTYIREDKGMEGKEDFNTLVNDRPEFKYSSWVDNRYSISVEKQELIKKPLTYM